MRPQLKTLINKQELSERISQGQTLQTIVNDIEERSGHKFSTAGLSKLASKFCIKMPRSGPRSGSGHPKWKGGRTINASGYVEVYAPNHPNRRKYTPYVLEHRLVMEKTLGRYLKPSEVVHHINGDKQDNRPENLEVFASNKEHLAKTLKGCVPNWTSDGKARMLAAHKGVKRKHFGLSEEKRQTARERIRTANAIRKALQSDVQPNKKMIDRYLDQCGITFQQASDMVSRHEPLPSAP